MTIQERAKIKSLISQAITEKGPIVLNIIPNNVLPSTVIPKAVYSPLKKCLRENFPEFFVFGTSGYETVDFADAPLAQFYRLLTDKVPYQTTGISIPLSTVAELAAQVRLEKKENVTPEYAQKLLRPYPGYQLTDTTPTPVFSTSELQFIFAIAYIDWRQLFKKLSQHTATAPTEDKRLEPMFRSKRSHHNKKPKQRN